MKIKPWNLNQVDIDDKEEFKQTLIDITREGRKLTPMEQVRLEEFLSRH